MPLLYSKAEQELQQELEAVARDAGALLEHLRTSNQPLPPDFPAEQLQDIASTLTTLPDGTAEGCREPLEYARNRLPAIRREHMHLKETQPRAGKNIDLPPDVERGQTLNRTQLPRDERRRHQFPTVICRGIVPLRQPEHTLQFLRLQVIVFEPRLFHKPERDLET